MKVIRIDGISGIITAIFVGACLFAGFIISPGYVAMTLWNKYLVSSYMFPKLSLFQGVLLWGIIAITYYILIKGRLPISFQSSRELRDEEIDSIIKSAKINSQMNVMNKIISKSDRFETNKNPFIKDDNKNNCDKNSEDKLSNIK